MADSIETRESTSKDGKKTLYYNAQDIDVYVMRLLNEINWLRGQNARLLDMLAKFGSEYFEDLEKAFSGVV